MLLIIFLSNKSKIPATIWISESIIIFTSFSDFSTSGGKLLISNLISLNAFKSSNLFLKSVKPNGSSIYNSIFLGKQIILSLLPYFFKIDKEKIISLVR